MKSKDQKYQEAINRAELSINRHMKSTMISRISKATDWKDAVNILRHTIGIRKNDSTPSFIVDFVTSNFKK